MICVLYKLYLEYRASRTHARIRQDMSKHPDDLRSAPNTVGKVNGHRQLLVLAGGASSAGRTSLSIRLSTCALIALTSGWKSFLTASMTSLIKSCILTCFLLFMIRTIWASRVRFRSSKTFSLVCLLSSACQSGRSVSAFSE